MNENIWILDFADNRKNLLNKYGERPYLIIQIHQEILVLAISNGSQWF